MELRDRTGDRVRFTSGRYKGQAGEVTAVIETGEGLSWHVKRDGTKHSIPGNGPDNLERVAS